jgi:hypothetical protein
MTTFTSILSYYMRRYKIRSIAETGLIKSANSNKKR